VKTRTVPLPARICVEQSFECARGVTTGLRSAGVTASRSLSAGGLREVVFFLDSWRRQEGLARSFGRPGKNVELEAVEGSERKRMGEEASRWSVLAGCHAGCINKPPHAAEMGEAAEEDNGDDGVTG
jgi:hypothetical protein